MFDASLLLPTSPQLIASLLLPINLQLGTPFCYWHLCCIAGDLNVGGVFYDVSAVAGVPVVADAPVVTAR
jgi:hypothetical protein